MQQRILSSQLAEYVGQTVCLKGWLHRLRQLGEVNFLILRDRHGIAQAVLSAEAATTLSHVPVESIVCVSGRVVQESQAPGGYELHDPTVEVINPSAAPPPLEINKKKIKASLPFFLDHAVIGYRHLERRAIFQIASGIMQGFRQTLNAADFTEIQTPKLVGTSTESGANVYAVEHFGQTAYLAQSPQFYKQIMVGVFERVYEVGPVFRAEKHSTTRHINEYVSMDVELGFIHDHFDVMAVVTQVITGILEYLSADYSQQLALLKVDMPIIGYDIQHPIFPYIHFADAQQMLAEQFGMKDAIGAPDLTPEHERLLGKWAQQKYQSDFLFVVGYPMQKRPFYTHPDPDRPDYSNSFDLLFRGLELITGGQRLHRYEDYITAIEKMGHSLESYAHYLEAFQYGMPPHGGFAIGLERFVMQLLKLDNIRLATLFPRDIHRLVP
ncbi:MAG: aspartate--tRNA(Asn) ligase [Phototrophicales bacterium]|nr:MAG: aspartate--tRNA(Asn) ligase [Phototrophicales bacterium]